MRGRDECENACTSAFKSLVWGGEWLVWCIGPLFVCLALTLIVSVIYTDVCVIVPSYAPQPERDLLAPFVMFNFALTAFLGVNILYNYVRCVIASPGRPPALDLELATVQETTRFCKKCRNIKPVRAHHCSVCNKCVLKMDHHCPWISNCVGHSNHKAFVLFLSYLWVGTLYTVLLGWQPFNDTHRLYLPFGCGSRSTLMFTVVLCMAVWVAVGGLLAWQLYLVLTNQTTIEFYHNRAKKYEARMHGEVYENPFDLGLDKNLSMFCGTALVRWPLVWMLPCMPQSEGDGMVWLTRREFACSRF